MPLYSVPGHHGHPHHWRLILTASLLLGCLAAASLHAAEPETQSAPKSAPKPAEAGNTPLAEQLRQATSQGKLSQKQLTVVVNGNETTATTLSTLPAKPARPSAPSRPAVLNLSRTPVIDEPAAPAVEGARASASAPSTVQRARAKAHGQATSTTSASHTSAKAAHTHTAHWDYEGEAGSSRWGQLQADFKTCAAGQRQSPIHIQSTQTLQGPAEPIQFNYQDSTGIVVNNGHTIQVDVVGDNSIQVRNTRYDLVQFHFHHPAEERINDRVHSMVAHLVHRNAQGQLAVVAILIDPGQANPLIHKVWTYMPLDSQDSVRMPGNQLNLGELLPKDQRYYQYLGSLTTPPCTEGVLWLVLKQPVTLSREQIRLFGQLYPYNARPVQPVNGRPIREAQ